MVDTIFHAVLHLDTETGILFWENPPKNHAQRAGTVAGFICIGKGKNKNYWHVRALGRTYKRSRLVFYMMHGRWPTPAVDHINGDSLDDRPSNLRECSQSLNTSNSRDKARRHPLPRGVYRTKQGRYMGRHTKDGVTVSVGTYETIEQAKAAYEAARLEAFGEHA